MAQNPEKSGREILPIPDVPAKGKIALDARKAEFPEIKPLRPPEGAPNVVIVLIDDMGWPDVACYGSKFHETPNIDRLTRELTDPSGRWPAVPERSIR